MRSDAHGIMGLPFKLAIIMVVIAVMTPIVAGVTQDAKDVMDLMQPENEASELKDAASRLYYSNVGSTVTVDLSLGPDECLMVGGEGTEAYTIRIVRNGEIEKRIYIDHPEFPFLGGATAISGTGPVKLECVIEDDIRGVRVIP